MVAIEAWFDGVCEPRNPGGHAAWGALVLHYGRVVLREGGYVGYGSGMSNNVAEYSGVIACFESIRPLDGVAIIRGDSKLVVNQLSGKWKINGGLYMPYYRRAAALWAELRQRASLEWIPRSQNDACDELSKQVLLERGVEFRIQPR